MAANGVAVSDDEDDDMTDKREVDPRPWTRSPVRLSAQRKQKNNSEILHIYALFIGYMLWVYTMILLSRLTWSGGVVIVCEYRFIMALFSVP